MSDDSNDDKDAPAKGGGRFVAFMLTFAAGILFVGEGLLVQSLLKVKSWEAILTEHIQAIAGLQIAAAVALWLVIFLSQSSGPIKVAMPGFEFKGAAGQIVMWILCFLAIAGAIKLLW